MKTSFAPAPSAPPEVGWETGVKGIAVAYDKNGEIAPNRYVLTLTKDVPNDDGLLQVKSSDGKKTWLRVEALSNAPYEAGKPGQMSKAGLDFGTPTTSLYARLQATMVPSDRIAMIGSSALFLSERFPNLSPKPAGADAQKVLDLLDNIRIQLTKAAPG
jgi:hypothetical protein